jgi:hypothetical protein
MALPVKGSKTKFHRIITEGLILEILIEDIQAESIYATIRPKCG